MTRSESADRERPVAAGTVVGSLLDQTAADEDQTAADADQTAADTDQTAADTDQASSDKDEQASESDQRSSDADQTTADRDDAKNAGPTHDAYLRSREERARATRDRKDGEHDRTHATDDRSAAARLRDTVARRRDEVALDRDGRAASRDAAIARVDTPAGRALERLRLRAAADRAAAARDRARAAADRETAAQARAMAARDRERAAADLATSEAVRAEVESQLKRAHLDDLTGAYRRDMGRLAISHEIDRARRGDGRFVLCFFDVDNLKGINDGDGHLAGDRALTSVVAAVRASLRSFDPILRYGGDEFIAGLGGTDVAGARRRFREVQATLDRTSGVQVSVGFADLQPGDAVDDLIDRADRDLYARRATEQHEGRSEWRKRPRHAADDFVS
jgi:diguanylate cyclase (GGDEF)-like protein